MSLPRWFILLLCVLRAIVLRLLAPSHDPYCGVSSSGGGVGRLLAAVLRCRVGLAGGGVGNGLGYVNSREWRTAKWHAGELFRRCSTLLAVVHGPQGGGLLTESDALVCDESQAYVDGGDGADCKLLKVWR